MSEKPTETKSNDSSAVDVSALQQELDNAKAKANHYEKIYKGIDPDEHFAIKTQLEKALTKKQDNVDIEEYKKTLETKFQKEWQAKLDEQSNLLKNKDAELKNLKVNRKALEALGDVVNDDARPFLANLVDKYCDLGEGDNIVIKDDNGKPRYSQPDKLFTLSDFKSELINKFPSLIKPSVKQGTKENGQVSKSSSDITLDSYLNMSKQDIAKLDPALAYKLSSQALGGR